MDKVAPTAPALDPESIKREINPAHPGGRRGRLSRLHSMGLAPALVLAGILIAISAFDHSFFSRSSLTAMLEQAAVIGLLALGQSAVILLGRIDLSNAALASLSAVMLAKLLPSEGKLAVAEVLALALAIGAAQGAIHVYVQIPSFIVTLGALGVWSGVALTASGASTILVTRNYGSVSWIFDRPFGVPLSFLLVLLVTLTLMVCLRWLALGRRIRAIGFNQRAAVFSGIRVDRTLIIGFAIAGLFAGLAGLFEIAQLQSAAPSSSNDLLLPAIAAVIIGGTSITGGIGGFGRTMLGVLVITALRSGFDAIGINSAYQPIVYGLIIIVSIAITVDRSRTVSVP